jgi:hypothetical protein
MDPSRQLALVENNMDHHHRNEANEMANQILATANAMDPKSSPMSIATISSGFEKGDFLVREEKGQRVYFDFFEVGNFVGWVGVRLRLGQELYSVPASSHTFSTLFFHRLSDSQEAFNYIAYKGYIRMPREDEREWMDTMNAVHASVKGGMKYNTGKLLMVLFRPIEMEKE